MQLKLNLLYPLKEGGFLIPRSHFGTGTMVDNLIVEIQDTTPRNRVIISTKVMSKKEIKEALGLPRNERITF